MQRLTEIALEKAQGGVFARADVSLWVGGSPDRQWSMVKRALAAREIQRIHRGLYCLAGRYLDRPPDPLVLAQRIHGPSYLSFETALSFHGLIPEAVYTVTSACLDRAREFDTPLGRFSYTRVPQKTLLADVIRVERAGGESFLVASPLKALADYVHVHRCDWRSLRPVVESLRIEEEALPALAAGSFDTLVANTTSRRVRRFLAGLGKDLAR